jgi:hypothetical protein
MAMRERPLASAPDMVSTRSKNALVPRAAALCAVALLASSCGGGSGEAQAAAPRVFASAAVVGASASGGFGLVGEADREVKLADLLAAAAPGTFTALHDTSSVMFFMAPERRLDEALAQIEPLAPEIVVGVDALFWFAYGPRADGERVAFLQRGMATFEAFLDRTGAELLIGDFPDVRDASRMFMPDAYEPSDATLATLQAEVAAWAQRRDDVELVSLSTFVESMRSGTPVHMFGATFDTSDRARWMQNDGLHPTLEGTAALALMVLDVLGRSNTLAGLVTDPAEVARRVRAGVGGVESGG